MPIAANPHSTKPSPNKKPVLAGSIAATIDGSTVVCPGNIPEKMRQMNNWVCWKRETRKGRESKVPINPKTGRYASSTDPTTWADFETALNYYLEGNADGISFAITKEKRIVGGDLDQCRDPMTGALEQWAVAILNPIHSYSEVSPSGEGIRFFCIGVIPDRGHRQPIEDGELEIYDDAKFLTVTGNRLADYPALLTSRPGLRIVYDKHFPAGESNDQTAGKGILAGWKSSERVPSTANLFRRFSKAKELFEGGGIEDDSRREQGLANYAACVGMPPHDIADLLVAARRNVGEEPKHVGYYEETIAKALDSDLVKNLSGGAARGATAGATKEKEIPGTIQGSVGAGTAFRQNWGEGISERLAAIKARFGKHFYLSDPNVLDVTLGAAAGNFFETDPLWLFLVGAASCGKTELLLSLQSCLEIFYLSDLNPASLISGYKEPSSQTTSRPFDNTEKDKKKPSGKESKPVPDIPPPVLPESGQKDTVQDFSILPKLNGKTLVIKDFTVILEKPADTRAQVFSILRDIYDGQASKAFGNSEVKSYKSRFNILAGVTHAIEKSWSGQNTLGERFLSYRMTVADHREHARAPLDNDVGTEAIRTELQAAVKEFIATVPKTTPTVDAAMRDKIIDLAALLATCRTYVSKDRKTEELDFLPSPELPTRVAKQLRRLGLGVALVRGKDRLTDDEFLLMRKVALDSLPSDRRLLLATLWEFRDQPEPLEKIVAKARGFGESSVRRKLADLATLGVVTIKITKKQVIVPNKPAATTISHGYQLTDKFREYCETIGGVPRD